MTEKVLLNSAQYMTLKAADGRFQRLGLYATGEALVLGIGKLAVLAFLAMDYVMLHMIHSTYADEGHHSWAFAATGLVVVLSLHVVVEKLASKRVDRLLTIAAGLCVPLFILGTCLMLGTMALIGGISGLDETLPAIDAFFNQAAGVIDEAFGPSAFETLMTELAIPAFTVSVCTAFFLTVFLTKWLISWLVRRVPVVATRIAEARQSAKHFAAVKAAMAAECNARANLQSAQDKLAYWDNGKMADLVICIREEMLRPFETLLNIRRLQGDVEGSTLPIPHPDGGPAFDPAVMEGLLSDIRSALTHENVTAALNDAQPT